MPKTAPKTALETRGSVTRRHLASPTRLSIKLVTDAGSRGRITEILTREKVGFSCFDDLKALLAHSEQHKAALVVLSIDDTIAKQLASIEQLKQRFANAPLVALCSSIERWEIRAALAAGVAGVVMWKDIDSALVPCMQAVRAGQTCVPRAHSRQIEPQALSSREKQILGLVVMGYMNGQIAERLFLAESTVKSHLSSAFGKLGVRSRNEAVKLIVDPERGWGMGILALGGEPLETVPPTPQ